MLVGNKSDLAPEQRDVHVEEATNVAVEFGLSFLETSALHATNVDESFNRVLEEIYKLNRSNPVQGRIDAELRDPSGEIVKPIPTVEARKPSSKSTKCC